MGSKSIKCNQLFQCLLSSVTFIKWSKYSVRDTSLELSLVSLSYSSECSVHFKWATNCTVRCNDWPTISLFWFCCCTTKFVYPTCSFSVKMSSDPAESDDFTLDEQLGQGGFGLVYRGTFRGCDHAIKRILIGRLTPERDAREYDVMRRLDHPNIMKLIHMKDEKEFRLNWN